MKIALDLSEELNLNDVIFLSETNANMRKTWKIEREMTNIMIRQAENHNTPAKREKYVNMVADFTDDMIAFLIDILDLNPLIYKELLYEETSYFDCLNATTKITGAMLHVEPIATKGDDDFNLQQYKNQLKERYFFLDNAVKDFDYNELQIMTNLHIAPGDFEQENYYRLMEVLSALSPDERPMTGAGFLKSLNVNKDKNNDTLKGNVK